jgi:hypothetical protein
MSPEAILEEMKEYEDDEEYKKDGDSEEEAKETLFSTLIEQRDGPKEIIDSRLIGMDHEEAREDQSVIFVGAVPLLS